MLGVQLVVRLADARDLPIVYRHVGQLAGEPDLPPDVVVVHAVPAGQELQEPCEPEGILVMAYWLWHIGYGILVMTY